MRVAGLQLAHVTGKRYLFEVTTPMFCIVVLATLFACGL